MGQINKPTVMKDYHLAYLPNGIIEAPSTPVYVDAANAEVLAEIGRSAIVMAPLDGALAMMVSSAERIFTKPLPQTGFPPETHVLDVGAGLSKIIDSQDTAQKFNAVKSFLTPFLEKELGSNPNDMAQHVIGRMIKLFDQLTNKVLTLVEVRNMCAHGYVYPVPWGRRSVG